MKVVILAGGFGTRLSEETVLKPKPMVEIGEMPILWHIMKYYSHFGHNDFIICLGYKGYVIKEFFYNYFLHHSDTTIDIANNKIDYHDSYAEPWKVTLINTGLDTMTGGRIKRIQKYVGEESFMLTYGDGLSDVDINALIEFHNNSGKQATVTAVQPLGRFGSLKFDDDDNVESFIEKPKGDKTWINGGFFVLEPEIFKYIDNDSSIWEKTPLEKLATNKQLSAYKHHGFWQPMDTLRDKRELQKHWENNEAKWKVWND